MLDNFSNKALETRQKHDVHQIKLFVCPDVKKGSLNLYHHSHVITYSFHILLF